MYSFGCTNGHARQAKMAKNPCASCMRIKSLVAVHRRSRPEDGLRGKEKWRSLHRRFAMNTVLKSFLFAGTVLASSQALADDDPVYITKLIYNGTGCPLGSVASALSVSPRPTQFTLLFDSYVAVQGPGIPISERRKNCSITVGLHIPQGYQFTIAQVQYTGHLDLSYGVTGWQRSDYQFPFFSKVRTLMSSFPGPSVKDYLFTDTLPLETWVWSPCGHEHPLSIRTQIYMTGPWWHPSSMTTDTIDGLVKHVYGLKWRRCFDKKDRASGRSG
jgi:hypothetical protein